MCNNKNNVSQNFDLYLKCIDNRLKFHEFSVFLFENILYLILINII